MIERLTPYFPYYPYLLAGLLLLAVLLLLGALYSFWRQRTASVWRTRHDAGKRVGRLLVAGGGLLAGTLVVSVFSAAVIISLDYEDAFFPPNNPYGVRGVAVSALPTPTPSLDLSLDITALDDAITADETPVNPRARFQAPVERLHVFITYRGMTNNMPWATVLYRDDEPVLQQSAVWRLGRRGQDSFTLEPPDGLPAGSYTLQISVAGRVVADASFLVTAT